MLSYQWKTIFFKSPEPNKVVQKTVRREVMMALCGPKTSANAIGSIFFFEFSKTYLRFEKNLHYFQKIFQKK